MKAYLREEIVRETEGSAYNQLYIQDNILLKQSLYRHIRDPEGSRRMKRPDLETVGI
jgi:hypothetical protein